MGKSGKTNRKGKEGKGAERGTVWQFEQVPDVLLTIDTRRRVLLMSRSMDSFQPGQVLGKDSEMLFPAEIQKSYRKLLKRAFAKGEVTHFQYSTEQSVWWEVRIVPVRHEGKITEAMVICSDVTERRIRQAQAIRHARLATIGVLSAGVTHEINNPNGANLFNASLLGRAWQDLLPLLDGYREENGDFSLIGLPYDEARETLPRLSAEIFANTERIREIVDNLKHLSGRDEEKLDEQVDINHTLQAALMILNHKIRKHTDQCELHFSKGMPLVLGNSRQLEQVFINVVLNALQALPSRKEGVQIRTGYHPEDGVVCVVVKDEGCGVAEEDIGRLTEPFFTTRIKAGGTGLGLSISNLIILKHGGTIRFEPRHSVGTKVTITFPVRDREESTA